MLQGRAVRDTGGALPRPALTGPRRASLAL